MVGGFICRYSHATQWKVTPWFLGVISPSFIALCILRLHFRGSVQDLIVHVNLNHKIKNFTGTSDPVYLKYLVRPSAEVVQVSGKPTVRLLVMRTLSKTPERERARQWFALCSKYLQTHEEKEKKGVLIPVSVLYQQIKLAFPYKIISLEVTSFIVTFKNILFNN